MTVGPAEEECRSLGPGEAEKKQTKTAAPQGEARWETR